MAGDGPIPLDTRTDGFDTAAPTNSLLGVYAGSSAPVFSAALDQSQIVSSIAPTNTPEPSTGSFVSTATVATITPSQTASSAQATASSGSNSGGIPLSTLLPAILVPVIVVLIAVPALIFYWFHRRNKKLQDEQKRNSTPDMHGPPTNAALLQHKQSQPSLSLNAPYSDGEKSYGAGAYGTQDNSEKGVDKVPESAIMLNARNRSWSNEQSPSRGPSPTLPSPSVTKRPERPERPKERPTTQEAWPLPAHAILPDQPAHSTNKSQPTTTTTRSDNNDSLLPPVQLAAPLSLHDSLATDSSIYDLSSTTENFPDPPQMSHRPFQPSVADSMEIMNPTFYNKRDNKRESDLVSELSNPAETTTARTPRGRRDTDAVSVVSAITDRSRSQRRKSTASAVSAMSPEEPRLPMLNFPRR